MKQKFQLGEQVIINCGKVWDGDGEIKDYYGHGSYEVHSNSMNMLGAFDTKNLKRNQIT